MSRKLFTICVVAAILSLPACSDPPPEPKVSAPDMIPEVLEISAEESTALEALKASITKFAEDYPPGGEMYRPARERQREILAALKAAQSSFASKDGKAAYIKTVNDFLLEQIKAEKNAQYLGALEKAAQGTPSQRLVIIRAVDERKNALS